MREIDFYMSILIKSAKIIDASSKFNGKTQDILIINGKIQEINSEISSKKIGTLNKITEVNKDSILVNFSNLEIL